MVKEDVRLPASFDLLFQAHLFLLLTVPTTCETHFVRRVWLEGISISLSVDPESPATTSSPIASCIPASWLLRRDSLRGGASEVRRSVSRPGLSGPSASANDGPDEQHKGLDGGVRGREGWDADSESSYNDNATLQAGRWAGM